MTSEDEIFKVNRGSTAYIHASWYTATSAYDYEIWTQQAPGECYRTYSDRYNWIGGKNEKVWYNWAWLLFVGNNENATTIKTVLMKIKKETNRSFKSASFKSLGCTVIGGQLNDIPYMYHSLLQAMRGMKAARGMPSNCWNDDYIYS